MDLPHNPVFEFLILSMASFTPVLVIVFQTGNEKFPQYEKAGDLRFYLGFFGLL